MIFRFKFIRSFLLALSLLISAPLVTMQAQANPNNQGQLVASVLFEGNQRFSDAQLISMIDLASFGVFSDERLNVDIRSISLAYDGAGYTDVSVSANKDVLDNGRIVVTFIINEGDRSGIGGINFTGNNSIGANQLKDAIITKETNLLSWLLKDDSYDEDKLAYDSEVIRNYYANRGYPDAQVLSAVAEYDTSRRAYFINFTINEGEYYEFGNISIETSIPGLDVEVLKQAISTNEGSRYSVKKLTKTAQDMAFRATAQGYAFANVRPRIDRDVANRSFSITYLVDEGARIYVERVNIYGNQKTRDFVIRRELGFAEGDPFNRSIVTRAKDNIENLGFFSMVNVTSERGSAADKVVINIAVEEKSTGDYGFTAGYSSEQGVLGEISLTENNFLGRGQYLKVAIGATQGGQTYQFSFTEPRFMGLKISAGIDLYKKVAEETASSFYGSDATGGQFNFGMPITNELSTSVFVGFESKKFTDAIAPLTAIGIADGDIRTKAFVGYSLTYNGLDDIRKPTNGIYASLTQQYVGFDNNYIKTDIKARYFLPIVEDSGFIASVKGQAGIVSDLSGSGVHPTEAYVLGAQLVRGFTGGGMGPRILASGEGLGATWYAGLSAEVEFPIPVLPESYGLSGAIWADVGYVGPESTGGPVATAGTTQPLRSSIGASIIWDSPFGPLRGDFAHVLQKDAADSTQVFQLTMRTLL
ncbi:MAG: outer membrane protein assembly factor BamA [Devosiaceae bacterium]|nr:outer membrane protein assembly factor BamA [Devosiaceae bacterium]